MVNSINTGLSEGEVSEGDVERFLLCSDVSAVVIRERQSVESRDESRLSRQRTATYSYTKMLNK